VDSYLQIRFKDMPDDTKRVGWECYEGCSTAKYLSEIGRLWESKTVATADAEGNSVSVTTYDEYVVLKMIAEQFSIDDNFSIAI
jgi:hypothetical protein